MRSSESVLSLVGLCLSALSGAQQTLSQPASIKTPISVTYHVAIPPGNPLLRLARRQQIRNAYAELVKEKRVTVYEAKQRGDKAIADLGSTAEFDVVVASSGQSILYEQLSHGTPQIVFIFGQNQSTIYEVENQKLELVPDFDSLDIRYWPYLPFSIPPLKMFDRKAPPAGVNLSDYYRLSPGDTFVGMLVFGVSAGKGRQYGPAIMGHEANGEVSRVRLADDEFITYSRSIKAAGVMLPASITRERFIATLAPVTAKPRIRLSDTPTDVTHYTLKSYSTDPLPDSMFKISTYLGGTTSVYTDGFVYHYRPSDGDFDKVLDAQLALHHKPPREQTASQHTLIFFCGAGLHAGHMGNSLFRTHRLHLDGSARVLQRL